MSVVERSISKNSEREMKITLEELKAIWCSRMSDNEREGKRDEDNP
jgi:hypothetical protein